MSQLTWTCDECSRPIADGDGYVACRYIKAMQRRRARRAIDNRGRVDIAAVLALDDSERWHAWHSRCDPEPNVIDYWIDVGRIRTLPELLGWNRHLLEKDWVPYDSDWADFLVRKLDVR